MRKININKISEVTWSSPKGKWLVRSPERKLIRGEANDYFDGEE